MTWRSFQKNLLSLVMPKTSWAGWTNTVSTTLTYSNIMSSLMKETSSLATCGANGRDKRRNPYSRLLVSYVPLSNTFCIEIVKEITQVESSKFDLRHKFQSQIEMILGLKAYRVDETHFREEIVFKEGKFGYFNPLILEVPGGGS